MMMKIIPPHPDPLPPRGEGKILLKLFNSSFFLDGRR